MLQNVDYKHALKLQLHVERPWYGYDTTGGAGIVYVGGGKYWAGIAVGIHMLRHVGCDLPIEVWYRGQCETVYPEDVEGMGVRFRDVDREGSETGVSSIPQGVVASGGWEAKLTAMQLTSFSQVLYLDADAYVVNDPTPLFAKYSPYMLAYWKDLPNQERTVRWPNVWDRGSYSGVLQIQGGQLLINRVTGWHMIHLADFMCQNSNYFFKHMYGDQDAWRVALSALTQSNRPSAHCQIDRAAWESIAFVCSASNTPYVVHRCQGKLFEHKDIPKGGIKYSNPHYHLPREVEVFDFFAKVLNTRSRESTHVFYDIYSKKLWGSQPSGTGSRVKESQPYVDAVNAFIHARGYRTVVDCGSGDGLVSSKINCADYVGLDCYPSLVLANKAKYGRENRQYLALDFFKDRELIPSSDVLLCKDVLHHWPTHMIVTFLDYLTQSKKWKVLVFCQDSKQIHPNQDCPLGGYRALSLSMEPLARYPFVKLAKVFHKDLAIIEIGG